MRVDPDSRTVGVPRTGAGSVVAVQPCDGHGRRTWRRLLSIVSMPALLGAAACGTPSESGSARPTVRPTDANTIDEQACPGNASTTREAGTDSAPTVRVALVVPRTGAFPHWAQFGDGARAYFDSLNAQPQPTVRYEVTEIDDQLRSAETKRAVERAVNDGADLIVGIPSVANVTSVSEQLAEACLPLFTPAPATAAMAGADGGNGSGSTNGNDFVVASGLDLREEVRLLVSSTQPSGRQTDEEATGPDLALVYQDNAYGRGYLEATKNAAKQFDARLVASQAFDPLSAPDPRDAVAAAAKSHPDLLIIALEGAACPDALAFVEPKLVGQIAVSGACTPDPVIADAGADQVGVRGVVASLQPRDPEQRSLAAAETFVDSMAALHTSAGGTSADETNLTAEGWDVASVAAASVAQAQKAGALSRTGIIAAARALVGPAPSMWPSGAGPLDGSGSASQAMLTKGQLSERTKTFWRPITSSQG